LSSQNLRSLENSPEIKKYFKLADELASLEMQVNKNLIESKRKGGKT
jgi:hypothetical protein